MARHRFVDDPDPTFRLLFVCTGNICRSPFAEILMRHLLVGRLGARGAEAFDISSAGVQAVVGAPMHPDSRFELAPWGLHEAGADGFAGRQVRSAMVAASDLVLGASPRHRSAIVERTPVALRITFTLREFARLGAAVDPELLPSEPVARAHALVEQARLHRGLLPPLTPDEYSVPDPIGRSQELHHEAAELIHSALQSIVDMIAPVPVGDGLVV